MFNILKAIFATHQVQDLEADLYSPAYPQFRGEAELYASSNGRYTLEIELKHDNRTLSDTLALHVDDTQVGYVPVQASGRSFRRTERDGPLGFDPEIGQTVQLWDQDTMVFEGTFVRD